VATLTWEVTDAVKVLMLDEFAQLGASCGVIRSCMATIMYAIMSPTG
jgi:hypothetical protein